MRYIKHFRKHIIILGLLLVTFSLLQSTVASANEVSDPASRATSFEPDRYSNAKQKRWMKTLEKTYIREGLNLDAMQDAPRLEAIRKLRRNGSRLRSLGIITIVGSVVTFPLTKFAFQNQESMNPFSPALMLHLPVLATGIVLSAKGGQYRWAAKYGLERMSADDSVPHDLSLAARQSFVSTDLKRGRAMRNAGIGLLALGGTFVFGALTVQIHASGMDPLGATVFRVLLGLPLLVTGTVGLIAGARLNAQGTGIIKQANEQDLGQETAAKMPIKVLVSPTFGPKRAGMRLAMTF